MGTKVIVDYTLIYQKNKDFFEIIERAKTKAAR